MRASFVMVAALLAGCSTWSCPAYDTVTWRDPTLFHSLPPVDRENVSAYAIGPADGLAEPEGFLHTIRWVTTRGPGGAAVELRHDALSAIAQNETEAREALAAFLRAHALMGEDAQARRVAEAMGAGRTIGHAEGGAAVRMFTASGEGPWTFDAVFANATRLSDHDQLGRATFESGGHRVEVWYPVRGTSIAGFPARADADGRVEVDVGERVGRDPAGSVARLVTAMEAEGLPPPTDARAYSDPC